MFTPLRDFFFEGPSIVLLEDGPTSEQSSVLLFDELAEYTRCQQVHVVVAVDLLSFWKHFDAPVDALKIYIHEELLRPVFDPLSCSAVLETIPCVCL